jgi:plasmid maintenance system antidote protein VapI
MFFRMEPRFWLNLQSEYDIRVADRELRAKLSPRIRVFQPAAARVSGIPPKEVRRSNSVPSKNSRT